MPKPESTGSLYDRLFVQGDIDNPRVHSSLHAIMPSRHGLAKDASKVFDSDDEEKDYRTHLNRLSDAATDAAADDPDTSEHFMQKCCEHLETAARCYRASKHKK